MSVKFFDNLTLDIYVKKEFIKNVDLKKEEDLEKYLKKLFKTLKNKYNIIIEGFYDITVYIDKYYGVVLHLEKEDIDYYDYFKNQVDMRISTINTCFLYLVEDIPSSLINKVEICKIDDNIYLKIKKELTNIEMMKLLESSTISYNK